MARSKLAYLASASNCVAAPKVPKEPTSPSSHSDNPPRTPTKEEQLARRTRRVRALTANQPRSPTAQIEDISGPAVTMASADQVFASTTIDDDDEETTWLRETLEQAYRVTARGHLLGKRKRDDDDGHEVAMLFFTTPNTIWAHQDERSRCSSMPDLAGSSQETVESTERDPTTPRDHHYSREAVRAPSFSPITPTAAGDKPGPNMPASSFSSPPRFPHSRLRRSPPPSPSPVPRKIATPGTVFNSTTLLERYNHVPPSDLGPSLHSPARRVAWLSRHEDRYPGQWARDRRINKMWTSNKGLDWRREAFKIGRIEERRKEPETESEQEGWLGGQAFTEGVRRVLFLTEMENNAVDEGMGWVTGIKKRKMMEKK